MKPRPKVYPEHRCLMCHRTTTNKTYCPECEDFMFRPRFTPRELTITAPKGPTIWRRRETMDGGVTP